MSKELGSKMLKLGIFFGLATISFFLSYYLNNLLFILIGLIVAIILSLSFITVAQWEQVIVLRFGRFKRVLQPGMAFLVPFADVIAERVDQRIRVTAFLAEQTITKDTVPVNVDAALFWMVHDVKKAVLEVADYESAVSWAAQTTLREVIGNTHLSELLSNRRKLDQELQEGIDLKTEPWGITVQSVELRDITIPQALQDGMSKVAQAERERRARVLLSQAEVEVAERIAQAAEKYQDNPTALKLRTLNILSEGIKNKGSVVVIPTDALQQTGLLGLAQKETANIEEP